MDLPSTKPCTWTVGCSTMSYCCDGDPDATASCVTSVVRPWSGNVSRMVALSPLKGRAFESTYVWCQLDESDEKSAESPIVPRTPCGSCDAKR